MALPLLAVAAVATAGSMYYSNKQYTAQKKANAWQRKQTEMEQARARRDEVRRARMAHSQAVVTGEGQGVSTSSGAEGGQGSIISQGNSNLSFLDRSALISDQTSKYLGKAASYGNTAGIFSGISSIAMSFAGYAGGGGSGPAPIVHASSNIVKASNGNNSRPNYFTGG